MPGGVSLKTDRSWGSKGSFPTLEAEAKCRVSYVIDYSLTHNYMQLRIIIFISCNFAGLGVIGKISISRNYGVISRNFYT